MKFAPIMRDLRRVEKDAVILRNVSPTFFPQFKQTTIITQRLKGKVICLIERKTQFTLKGGES